MEAPEISNRSGQVGFGIRRPRSGFSIWSSVSGSKVCSRLDAPCTTLQALNAPCARPQELYSRPLPNSSGAMLSADDVRWSQQTGGALPFGVYPRVDVHSDIGDHQFGITTIIRNKICMSQFIS